MSWIFVTGSSHKIDEARRILGETLEHISIELPEIQAVKCEEVVESKARAAYEIIKKPVIVEDTGLRVLPWGQLPGALVRWFIDEVSASGICKMLDGFDSRAAIAETVIGTFDGKYFRSYHGEVFGSISDRPRGDYGFGWDRIFIPENSKLTLGEMDIDTKLTFSMRTKALMEFKNHGPTWT